MAEGILLSCSGLLSCHWSAMDHTALRAASEGGALRPPGQPLPLTTENERPFFSLASASRSNGHTWLGSRPMVTLVGHSSADLDILLQETSLRLWRILGFILLTEPAPLITLGHPPGTQAPVCVWTGRQWFCGRITHGPFPLQYRLPGSWLRASRSSAPS